MSIGRIKASFLTYAGSMRTTLTLDPDVASEIERIRQSDGRRFKQVVNDALRRGLREMQGAVQNGQESISPTRPKDLGTALTDLRSVSSALRFAEGEDHG